MGRGAAGGNDLTAGNCRGCGGILDPDCYARVWGIAVKIFRLVLALLITAGLLSSPAGAAQKATAQASPPPPLFVDGSGPLVSAASVNPTLARYRYVDINRPALQSTLDALAGDPAGKANALLALPFFPDAAYTARIDHVQRTFTGGYTLSGVLDGIPDSEVGLALEGDALVGHASLPGGHYTLGLTPDGLQIVGQVKPGQAPLANDTRIPPVSPGISAQGFYGDDDGSYVDVLVVYTPAIRSSIGGTSAMRAAINDLVTETNQGYINSQVSQRVRVVHTEEVDYNESTQSGSPPSLATMLYQLSNYPNGADGILDQVQTLRNTYAADLVVMLVDAVDPSLAGIAWVMAGDGLVAHAFEPYAYSVVTDFWYSNFYVFGHEMGHNMGAQHDQAHAGSPGAYPYSYGYCLPKEIYHTIMAYDGPCYYTINHWSNPAVIYDGVASGVSDSEDNHLTLNNTAPIVAQFRDGPSAAATPTGLLAAVDSPGQVSLHWTDNGQGETNLSLERASLAGGEWGGYSEIASLPAGTQTLADASVVCSTAYRYRLRAYYAGDGFTGYSNVAEVSIACIPPAPSNLTAAPSSPLPYQVVLNWAQAGHYQTGFRVERLDSGAWTALGATEAAVTTFTDASVACGRDYLYRVWAYNADGDSLSPSNSAAASILPCPPSGLILTPIARTRIDLHWNDTSQNEDGFRIERTTDSLPHDWTWHVDVGGGVTTYPDSSLSCDQSYLYRVWAFKAGLYSIAPSAEVTGVTLACPSLADFTATPRSASSIRLSWPDISGETAYTIERQNGSGWDPVANPPANSTTFVDTSLTPDTLYTYRILAHFSYGDSAYVIASARTYLWEFYFPFMMRK